MALRPKSTQARVGNIGLSKGMERVTIPNTNIEVSRIGFGTASLHQKFDSRERQKLLTSAYEEGITHFDTSPYYGHGLAEIDLGIFSKALRSNITITTKVGLYPSFNIYSRFAMSVWARCLCGKIAPHLSLPKVNYSVDRARQSLETSLRAIKSCYVDFLLIHEPNISLIRTEEWASWLDHSKKAGKIRAYGLAGVSENIAQLLDNDKLDNVIQTNDSFEKNEAATLLRAGRHLQFTYGYFSSLSKDVEIFSDSALMKKALDLNRTGSILISSLKNQRIKALARSCP